MLALFALICVVLFALWLLTRLILWNIIGKPATRVDIFWQQSVSWIATFLAGLTIFAGSLFWKMILAFHPIALLVLGTAIAGLIIMAWAAAVVSDLPVKPQASGKKTRISTWALTRREQHDSWEALWQPYRRKGLPSWMREALRDRCVMIDGQPWVIDKSGRLMPADPELGGEKFSNPLSQLKRWLQGLLD